MPDSWRTYTILHEWDAYKVKKIAGCDLASSVVRKDNSVHIRSRGFQTVGTHRVQFLSFRGFKKSTDRRSQRSNSLEIHRKFSIATKVLFCIIGLLNPQAAVPKQP